jgi:hypothetical protein
MADDMNPSHALVRPPQRAEAILRMFLRPDEAETESGDLLEAYRDSIYRDRGRWRADLWYMRQVAGYILRASARWGLLLGVVWVVGPFRMLLAQTDWFPSGIEQKAIATMVFFLAARRAWRSEQVRAGVLLAVGIAVAGSVMWLLGAVVQAARWDFSITRIESLRSHLDWSVFIMIPALSLIFACLLGVAGATMGKFLRVSCHIRRR